VICLPSATELTVIAQTPEVGQAELVSLIEDSASCQPMGSSLAFVVRCQLRCSRPQREFKMGIWMVGRSLCLRVMESRCLLSLSLV
jgi:hypothetical protein